MALPNQFYSNAAARTGLHTALAVYWWRLNLGDSGNKIVGKYPDGLHVLQWGRDQSIAAPLKRALTLKAIKDAIESYRRGRAVTG